MIDIAPELLEIINEFFNEGFNKSEVIQKLNKLLLEKNVNYDEANKYAIEIGILLSKAYEENIKAENLPNGILHYNIAKKVIEPTLFTCYELISSYSKGVQDSINKKYKIGIKGIKAPINQSKVDGIVKRVSEGEYEKTKWILKEPIINFSQSIVDSTVKVNAEFHVKSGLKPKIIRKEHGNCCDWCKEIVGEYQYPDGVPDDVYKRHRNCRCTVEYVPGDGRRQDVHTKTWYDSNGKSKRQALAENIQDIKIIETKRKIADEVLNRGVGGIKINTVADHLAERLIERKVDIEDVKNAIDNPLKIGKMKTDRNNRKSFYVIGEKATVYINPDTGTLTTVHKTHTKKAKKLMENKNETEAK